jgi:GNAT superfamily N-acetyltransferase
MTGQVATALEFVAVQSNESIALVAQLAREIWPEHYVNLIGQAQVDYMLARFQSEAAIAAQLVEGYEYFLIRRREQWLGYASVRVDSDGRRLFISKLYLLSAVRQQGLGRASINYLAQLTRQRGLHQLWLTVHKHNPSLRFYLWIGFVKVADVVTDIGNGYVMDDYQLEWTPASDTNN